MSHCTINAAHEVFNLKLNPCMPAEPLGQDSYTSYLFILFTFGDFVLTLAKVLLRML